MKIDDNTGSGNGLKIDDNSRAHTQAVIESEALHAAEVGDAYNINTGLISFTANGTLLYIKNNGDKELIIEAVAIGSFEGVTYSDDPYITLVKNPTTGDLISDASDVSMNQNRNFGSSKSLSVNAYKGKSAGTLTDGFDVAILQVTPGGRSFYPIDFVLPKGSSLGIKLTLNASSGTANYYAAAITHLKDQAAKD